MTDSNNDLRVQSPSPLSPSLTCQVSPSISDMGGRDSPVIFAPNSESEEWLREWQSVNARGKIYYRLISGRLHGDTCKRYYLILMMFYPVHSGCIVSLCYTVYYWSVLCRKSFLTIHIFSELIDCSLSLIDANTTVDEACDVSLYRA